MPLRQLDRLPALARELVQLRMDVIICVGQVTVRAAREATSTIPIVMYLNTGPVAQGLVKNLARPEANLTGVLISADGTLAGKRLELLRELLPRASRIAVLAPDDPNFQLQLQETKKGGRRAQVFTRSHGSPGQRLQHRIHGYQHAQARRIGCRCAFVFLSRPQANHRSGGKTPIACRL